MQLLLPGRVRQWFKKLTRLPPRKTFSRYLAIIETVIWIWETSELPGTAIQVDKAGPKNWQETHFGLPRVLCGETETDWTLKGSGLDLSSKAVMLVFHCGCNRGSGWLKSSRWDQLVLGKEGTRQNGHIDIQLTPVQWQLYRRTEQEWNCVYDMLVMSVHAIQEKRHIGTFKWSHFPISCMLFYSKRESTIQGILRCYFKNRKKD